MKGGRGRCFSQQGHRPVACVATASNRDCSSAGSAGGGVRQDAAVELLVGGGNHIDVELGVHLGARPLAQARSAPHLIERPDDALGKVVGTVAGREVAVVPMSDDVLGTTTVE